jgi:hypothetical protein
LVKAEAIDGETFMSLNAALLHQMGIRMGPAIRLQQVIKHAKVRTVNIMVQFIEDCVCLIVE